MGIGDTTLLRSRTECGTAIGNVVFRTAVHVRPELNPDPETERSLRVWSAGQYERISQGFRDEAEVFVDRLGLRPDHFVLDAAAGTGNLTIPAARTGACVTGFDLVPGLLEVALDRSDREGLSVRFDQGSVEELPYVDEQFDVVMSMFGVMFAARPENVVAELARVTRPGGRVALANWTRDGFVGKMLAAHVRHVPPATGVPSPLLWGDDAIIRDRFDAAAWDVAVTRRTLTFHYPHTPAGTAELFRSSYGPTVRAFEALDEDGRASLAAELAALWSSAHRGGPHTVVDSEYVEVIATRR